MQKIQHATNNLVLGAPRGWDQKEIPCDALAVTATTVEGQACLKSYWKPSKEEIMALATGGYIELSVFGMGQPPVMLSVVQE